MPTGTRFGEAVVCEGAWYADTNLQAFRLEPGRSILIYGASGAIGTAAVQLAKSYGAKVMAVVATQHLDLVRSLGAGQIPSGHRSRVPLKAIADAYRYVETEQKTGIVVINVAPLTKQ